jgi:hypothetical protein
LWAGLDLWREQNGDLVIVTGDAQGADALAVAWAKERKQRVDIHFANWSRYGKRAGPMRNSELVAACDVLIAYWGGESFGTRDTILKAQRAGLPIMLRPTRPDLFE